MEKSSLAALARRHLAAAQSSPSGRSAHTIYGGHEHVLRKTLIALVAHRVLDDHKNPGEATLQIIEGRVVLTTIDASWDGRTGDQLVIPSVRHGLRAIEDAVVLLTVAKPSALT